MKLNFHRRWSLNRLNVFRGNNIGRSIAIPFDFYSATRRPFRILENHMWTIDDLICVEGI
jgi:hypothetical protein